MSLHATFSWEGFQEFELTKLVISSGAPETEALMGLVSGELYVPGVLGTGGANWPKGRGFQDSRATFVEHWFCVGRRLRTHMLASLLVIVTTGRTRTPTLQWDMR